LLPAAYNEFGVTFQFCIWNAYDTWGCVFYIFTIYSKSFCYFD